MKHVSYLIFTVIAIGAVSFSTAYATELQLEQARTLTDKFFSQKATPFAELEIVERMLPLQHEFKVIADVSAQHFLKTEVKEKDTQKVEKTVNIIDQIITIITKKR